MSAQRDYIVVEPNMKAIALDTCRRLRVSLDSLRGDERGRWIAWPRQEFMWTAHQTGRWSLGQIGQFLGGRDHTTVLHGIRAHSARMCGDRDTTSDTDAALVR